MLSEEQQQFLQNAHQEALKAGLPDHLAKLAVSQAALETGYGRSVEGNNFFGIKAGKNYSGKTQEFTTHEVYNGRRTKIRDRFRAYDNASDSFRDWADLIRRGYPDTWNSANFDEAVEGLVTGKWGAYATDPDYRTKVRQIGGRVSSLALPRSAPIQRKELGPVQEVSFSEQPPNTLRSTEPRDIASPRPTLEELPAANAPITFNNNGRDNESDFTRQIDTSNRSTLVDTYREQRAQAEADREAESVGFAQDFGTQFIEEQSLARLSRSIGNSLNADPDFVLDGDRVVQEIRNLNLSPARFGPAFDSVHSEEQFQATLQEIQETAERQQRLGFGGSVAASLGAAILDPVALGAEAITLGAAAPLTRGLQLGRVGTIGVNAALGASAGAASEFAVGSVSGDLEADNVLLAGAIGAGLGGVVGALARNPALTNEASQVARIAEDLQTSTSLSTGNSAGAARAGSTLRPISDDAAFDAIQDEDAARSFFGGKRFDVIGRIKNSNNPAARLVFGGLAKDAAGSTGDEVIPFSVTETFDKIFTEFDTVHKRVHSNQLRDYIKRNKVGFFKRNQARIEFNEKVADFIEDRSHDAIDKYDPAVVKVGNRIRKSHEQLRELAANPRHRESDLARAVRGFDEIPNDPHYLTRVWDSRKLTAIRQEYGDTTIEMLIEKGIRRQVSDIEPDKAKAVAKAFTKSIVNRAYGFDDIASRPVSADSIEEIGEVLREHGLSLEDTEAFLKKFKNDGDSGRVATAKRRLFLDVSAELSPEEIRRLDGTAPDKPLRLKDLLVRDADYLHKRYVRQLSGRIALAKYRVHDPKTGELIVDGITSDADFNNVLKKVRAAGVEKGIDDVQLNKDENLAQHIYDFVTGKPLGNDPNSLSDKVIESLLDYNFLRVFNQGGFAQLPEISNVLHSLGIKAALSQMPSFRRIVNSSGEEVLANGLARDLENFLFDGVDRIRNTVDQRADDLLGTPEFQAQRGIGPSLRRGLRRGTQITADISLLNGVNMALTRWTSKAIIQKFVDAAHGSGKGLKKSRLRDLGLDDSMTERIFEELRKADNVVTEKGFLTGNKVTRFNPDAWTDREALEAFRDAAWRFGRTIIQRNDIGMMHEWMSKPLSRLIFQFRTFSFGAYTNGLLLHSNLARRGDGAALGWFLTSAVMAATVNAARVQINSIGRSDREQYLERELDPARLAAAGVSRSGYSSILPMLIDTAVLAVPGVDNPLFDFRTTTGVADLILGSPSGDLVNLARNLPSNLLDSTVEGRPISREEVNQVARALPFQNFIPIVLLLNSLTSELPKRPPKEFN